MHVLLAAPGPTLTISGWVTFILTTAAVLTAVGGIGVFVVKFTRNVVRPAIVLAEIATHFGEGYQETISGELQVLAQHGEKLADNQQSMIDRLDSLAQQTARIDEKLTETRHKVIGEFAALRMGGEATITVVEALERTSEKLGAIERRLSEMNAPPSTPPQQ